MDFNPKYSVLQDMEEDVLRSQVDDETLTGEQKGFRAGFWPSAASLKYEQINPNDGTKTVITEGQCLRSVYYSSVSEKITELPEMKMMDIWDFGSALEELYKDRVANMSKWRLVFPDVRGRKLRFRSSETKISGEIDLVIENKATLELIGVEIKSYYGFYAAMDLAGYPAASAATTPSCQPYIKVNDSRRTKTPFPKAANLLQVMLYLEQFWNKIKTFKLIYLARDKGPTIEFDITLADHSGKRCAVVDGVTVPHFNLEAIHARYAEVASFVADGTPPPPDFVPEYTDEEVRQRIEDGDLPKSAEKKLKNGDIFRDWQCGCCSFLSKCLTDQDKQTSIF